MRRPYIHLAGNLSGWAKGFTPSYQHLKKLDQFSSELVNGDDGGTWAPESPIVVGPTGVGTTITLNNGSILSGDIETLDGAQAGAGPGETAGMIITGGNFPAFQTARARDVVIPIWSFADTSNVDGLPTGIYNIDPKYIAGTRVGSLLSSESDNTTMLVPFPVRARHRGATIASIDFLFRVKAFHASLPVVLPRFRVIKYKTNDTFVTLHTAAGSYDANGWLTDAAGTTAAYYNGGLTRTITYTPDQNNTNLDPTDGFFLLQIRDERMDASPELGNIYMSAVVHLTGIADYRQE